jgi:uncharacterized protein (TIGR01244 family)
MIGRPLADGVWVSGQIALEDLADLAAEGIRTIVNNRPDGESHDQPPSSVVEAAAHAVGLGYVHAPVSGMPGAVPIGQVASVLTDGKPVLLYCRSGMRSAATWALAVSGSGALDRARILEATGQAGFDLSGLPL